MRILLVTWNYPPKMGGMEMMLSQLVENLLPHAEVDVLAPHAAPSDLGLEKSKPNKQIIRPSRDGLRWFFLSTLFSGLQLLGRQPYDVIIAGSTLVTPLTYLLGRFAKLPTVVNVYGLDVIYPHPLYQWIVRTFLPRADGVFAISQAAKEAAIQQGVSPERVSIISPGVNFAEFANLDFQKPKELDGRLILLSAGRLAKRKGILQFISHSFPAIVKACPNVLFLVVGENPTLSLTHKEDLRTQIEAEVHRLGLEKHVQLLGRVDRKQLIQLYHDCDVFVLPAIKVAGDMEGFGIVLIEASAAAKAVVSTRLGGIPDAVADGESGLLVEAESWDNLSTAIIKLLQNESLRQQMGQFGRQRVQTEFDWPIVGRRYAEKLANLLAKVVT